MEHESSRLLQLGQQFRALISSLDGSLASKSVSHASWWRGRHVMRSFCCPTTILPLSPSDGSENFRSALISPTRHSQFKSQRNCYDEPRGPTALLRQSARFRSAHPPVASSPPDMRPPSLIEKRYALLPTTCAYLIAQ